MDIKQVQTTKLSLEDSAFLEKVIEENERVINITIYNCLGKEYSALTGDAVGELYLLCCKKVEVLRNHESPKAWLIVTARLITKALIKKYNKEKPGAFIEVQSGEDVFEECVYSIWRKEGALEKVLSKLTKREKEVYRKLYVEKKKPKEAAAELGVSVNLVNNVKRNLKNKINNIIKNNKI